MKVLQFIWNNLLNYSYLLPAMWIREGMIDLIMKIPMETRRLTVRNNSDELLKRANDYFKQYPRVVITEYQPPPIIEILKKELQFYEKKNFSDQ